LALSLSLSLSLPLLQYNSYLKQFRLNPAKQVEVGFHPTSEDHKGEEFGQISIDIKGLWAETILYEVPIIYIVSQAYYCTVHTKWDYVGQEGQQHPSLFVN
jgi:nicotinate phosphoribosyltransferase